MGEGMSTPCPPKTPAYRAAGLGSRRILPGGTQAVATATAGALAWRNPGRCDRDSGRLQGLPGSEPQDPAPAESRLAGPQAVATATAGAFRDLPRRRRGSEPRDSARAESRPADNYRAAAARRFANRSAISRAVRTA